MNKKEVHRALRHTFFCFGIITLKRIYYFNAVSQVGT